MEEQKDINEVAMTVILNAGNGRAKIDEALECIASKQYEKAKALLEDAEKDVVKAHIAQTQMIQNQVSGNQVEYSLLFIHAQDTIMTINTELRLTTKFLKIIENL